MISPIAFRPIQTSVILSSSLSSALPPKLTITISFLFLLLKTKCMGFSALVKMKEINFYGNQNDVMKNWYGQGESDCLIKTIFTSIIFTSIIYVFVIIKKGEFFRTRIVLINILSFDDNIIYEFCIRQYGTLIYAFSI